MLCEKTKDKIKEQIDDVLSNFKTEKVITLLGNWNITIDVPPKMNSRLEEHYKVVSCDNNNFDIYTSKVIKMKSIQEYPKFMKGIIFIQLMTLQKHMETYIIYRHKNYVKSFKKIKIFILFYFFLK